MERRLAAIFCADMVGYSRLMELDEAGTIARQKALLEALINPKITERGGRIVKTTGDGLLVEFVSVVDAVACAAEVQQAIAERESELPEERRISYRVGINLGDIIIDGDDILGDGVNIAARLQEIADPGGICIRHEVREQVGDKLGLAFEDLGEVVVKNIARPIHIWRWREAEQQAVPASSEPSPLPDKPSIAVLPFDNMSGDPEQEYFADGIAEDIITRLSHDRWFFVIARNSSFAFKHKSVDVKQVSAELGVRYVLEGSVRKAGNRVRISTQLIDATTGNHLWADRYDRNLEDIFAVQDEITETVVATIEPQLYAAESERSHRKAPEKVGAWDLVIRALPHFWQYNESGNFQARELLMKATALDSGYAQAQSLLALVLMHQVWMGWANAATETLSLAGDAARAAVKLDEQDSWAHLAIGQVYAYDRDYENAIDAICRAIDLNPSFAWAHAWLGMVLGYAGKPEGAIEEIDLAVRISPRDPFNALYPAYRSVVHFAAGRYEEAVSEARQSIGERPEFVGAWRMLTVSLAHLGLAEEARHALGETKRLQPSLSLAWAREFAPWARENELNRYVEGLRKAGLPE